jgi:hypothetical protein
MVVRSCAVARKTVSVPRLHFRISLGKLLRGNAVTNPGTAIMQLIGKQPLSSTQGYITTSRYSLMTLIEKSPGDQSIWGNFS